MSSPSPLTFEARLQTPDGADAVDVRLQVLGRVLTVQGGGVSRAVPLGSVQQWRRDDGSLVLGFDDRTEVVLADGHSWEGAVGFGAQDAPVAATTVGAATVSATSANVGVPALASPRPADRGSWVPLAVLATAMLGVAVVGYAYAIPAASRWLIGLVPLAVDTTIGDVTFASMDGSVLQPSSLAPATQERLRGAFNRAVRAVDGDAATPTRIEFRQGDMGPNAFALPGGRIVVTDELVTLVDGREDVVVGVLGHEYGHAKARHGVRMVAQATLLQTVASAFIGDYSRLLAGAPQVLGEQAYSRDFEREADAEGVRVLRAGGYSPSAMVVFFEKLAEKRLTTGRGLAIAFASHPADAERVDYFTRADAAQ